MYRFVKLASHRIKAESTDPFMVGLNEGTAQHTKIKECVDALKIWSKHRTYVADSIFHSAQKEGYVDYHGAYSLVITSKGENLTEGFGWGFIRELIAKEWKVISIAGLVISFVVGIYATDIREFIIKVT